MGEGRASSSDLGASRGDVPVVEDNSESYCNCLSLGMGGTEAFRRAIEGVPPRLGVWALQCQGTSEKAHQEVRPLPEIVRRPGKFRILDKSHRHLS